MERTREDVDNHFSTEMRGLGVNPGDLHDFFEIFQTLELENYNLVTESFLEAIRSSDDSSALFQNMLQNYQASVRFYRYLDESFRHNWVLLSTLSRSGFDGLDNLRNLFDEDLLGFLPDEVAQLVELLSDSDQNEIKTEIFACLLDNEFVNEFPNEIVSHFESLDGDNAAEETLREYFGFLGINFNYLEYRRDYQDSITTLSGDAADQVNEVLGGNTDLLAEFNLSIAENRERLKDEAGEGADEDEIRLNAIRASLKRFAAPFLMQDCSDIAGFDAKVSQFTKNGGDNMGDRTYIKLAKAALANLKFAGMSNDDISTLIDNALGDYVDRDAQILLQARTDRQKNTLERVKKLSSKVANVNFHFEGDFQSFTELDRKYKAIAPLKSDPFQTYWRNISLAPLSTQESLLRDVVATLRGSRRPDDQVLRSELALAANEIKRINSVAKRLHKKLEKLFHSFRGISSIPMKPADPNGIEPLNFLDGYRNPRSGAIIGTEYNLSELINLFESLDSDNCDFSQYESLYNAICDFLGDQSNLDDLYLDLRKYHAHLNTEYNNNKSRLETAKKSTTLDDKEFLEKIESAIVKHQHPELSDLHVKARVKDNIKQALRTYQRDPEAYAISSIDQDINDKDFVPDVSYLGGLDVKWEDGILKLEDQENLDSLKADRKKLMLALAKLSEEKGSHDFQYLYNQLEDNVAKDWKVSDQLDDLEVKAAIEQYIEQQMAILEDVDSTYSHYAVNEKQRSNESYQEYLDRKCAIYKQQRADNLSASDYDKPGAEELFKSQMEKLDRKAKLRGLEEKFVKENVPKKTIWNNGFSNFLKTAVTSPSSFLARKTLRLGQGVGWWGLKSLSRAVYEPCRYLLKGAGVMGGTGLAALGLTALYPLRYLGQRISKKPMKPLARKVMRYGAKAMRKDAKKRAKITKGTVSSLGTDVRTNLDKAEWRWYDFAYPVKNPGVNVSAIMPQKNEYKAKSAFNPLELSASPFIDDSWFKKIARKAAKVVDEVAPAPANDQATQAA